MPHRESRMEAMLFNYETTHRTDYRTKEITPLNTTKYKAKPGRLKVTPPPLKDLHTLTDWKTAPVPFSLTHEPKPIIRTDPNKVRPPFVDSIDTEKEHCIKTRPRLVMTPAVSMDDVTDPRARQILCDDIYTSETMRALREAVSSYLSVKAPLPGLPAPANPIKLPQLNFPYVSPEWRMDSVSWDKKQLRTYCDSTKEFWVRRESSPCSACQASEIVDADRKMRLQMQAGRH